MFTINHLPPLNRLYADNYDTPKTSSPLSFSLKSFRNPIKSEEPSPETPAANQYAVPLTTGQQALNFIKEQKEKSSQLQQQQKRKSPRDQ